MDEVRLAERVAAVSDWYHTMELAPGVVTPGWFDTRPVAARLPWPNLRGLRCLDVGTYDGFWAFEMERRGAAEVVAADVLDPARWDWPPGSPAEVVEEISARKRGNPGFELAREALGSSVRLVDRSIYELARERDGDFDVVFVGSLLLHLRDPVGALEAVRSVCRRELVLSDAVHPPLAPLPRRRPTATLDGLGRPWWWKPNLAALRALVERAGFEVTTGPMRLRVPRGARRKRTIPSLRVLRSVAGREELASTWRGDPHAALRARPA